MPTSLTALYRQFDLCVRCRSARNPLRHILGGGQTRRPKFLFLFINPTHHNISSHPDYAGKYRFPFLGVRYFYKVMAEAGFADPQVVSDIYARGWRTADERALHASWRGHGVYITNLVKCTQPHPDNPSREVVAEDLPLLFREIELVRPEYIVTFGALPTKSLTGQDVRLSDYLTQARRGDYIPLKSVTIGNRIYPVLPCFFPVGRGNPPKAIEVLRFLRMSF